MNEVFIISNDIVTTYYSFENEGKTWLFVVYESKNGKKPQAGWKRKTFLLLAAQP
ncbi:hypothetical protein [Acinetobacter baumannii]|uniref:hypothetical protein n=1 Tax=Acinetobacter baumannii TaxID=470 RepID=UPI00249A84EA|nr:hypothetical protein [Acinetobacter baumannii]MDI2700629.1 hypothetical protein [Acinetobacter baumannii]MDI7714741.1 hypothetical protein [Acinetobacter baumannii]